MPDVATSDIAASDIKHPRLRRLYEYWAEKRGERALPARADLDPLDMTFVIGNLILVDVLPGEPLGFRIRLHGTNLAERIRFDLTGKMLEALPQPEFRELTRQTFTKVAITGKPMRVERDRLIDDRALRYETIILPLSSDGTNVDRLICGLFYERPDGSPVC